MFSLSLLSASQPKYWCVRPVEKPVPWRTQSADSRGYQSADNYSIQSSETPQSTDNNSSADHSSLLSAELPPFKTADIPLSVRPVGEFQPVVRRSADIPPDFSPNPTNLAPNKPYQQLTDDFEGFPVYKSNMAASRPSHLDDFYIDMTGVEPKAGTIVSSKFL